MDPLPVLFGWIPDEPREAGGWLRADIDLAKAKALQHTVDGAPGVVGGGLKDAVLQRGLLELALGFDADLAFKVGVGRRKQAGVAGIDFGPGVVDAGAEDFRGGQLQGYFIPLNCDVAGPQVRKIDAADNFSVHDQQQAIADQKFGQVGIGVLAGNDFVHGIADCFEALELLNLTDHRWLVNVDASPAAMPSADKTT